MDKDTDGLYDSVQIHEVIGGVGGQLVATWKGKKDYRVIPVQGESWVIRGVNANVAEKAELRLFGGHLMNIKLEEAKCPQIIREIWY